MNTTTYLQKQIANINSVYHSLVDDLTDMEWLTRPAPNQNMIGYALWHIPRTQDTFVQTWIRNVPEIAHGERWTKWRQFKGTRGGIGISMAEADEIARNIPRDQVIAYADATCDVIIAWLNQIDQDALDQVPDVLRHLAPFPEYQTPGFQKDTHDLIGLAVWGILMRPCIGHIYRHLGEVQLVKNMLHA